MMRLRKATMGKRSELTGTETARRILAYMRRNAADGDVVSATKVGRGTGLSRSCVGAYLARMVELGCARRVRQTAWAFVPGTGVTVADLVSTSHADELAPQEKRQATSI